MWTKREFNDCWFSGGFGKDEAKASLYLHPSSQLWGCFVIFCGFPDDAGVDPDTGYDFRSVKFQSVFCLCGVLGYHWSPVLHSSVSDVFHNPGSYVVAHLAMWPCHMTKGSCKLHALELVGMQQHSISTFHSWHQWLYLQATQGKDIHTKKKTPWPLVHKWTIPTERPPHVGKVSANFCG
jgi:hypothetical protein